MSLNRRFQRAAFFASLRETLAAPLGNRLASSATLKRSAPLLLLSLMDTGGPLLRIFVLTRLLPLREVGLATILVAYFSFLNLSTDIAIHRFIFSAERGRFDDAIGAAHALAVARGLILGVIAVVAAPIVASALSLGADWSAFALFGPMMLLMSLEHLGPRIAERDFQYGPQIRSNLAAYSVGLLVLIAVAATTRNHIAIIASWYAHFAALAVATRIFAPTPYRLSFRSPLLKSAFKYAYPLVFSGVGAAIVQQGDRFFVAALFDLTTVAVYSIIVTTASVPGLIINRFFSSTILARLYHATPVPGLLRHEVSLSSSLSAVIAAFYGGGIAFLIDFVATTVFGPKFHVGVLAMSLLGLAAFLRFIRTEPFNALMLNVGRTKRLAAASLIASTTLAYMVAIAMVDHSIEAILLARVVGEATALAYTIYAAVQVRDAGRLVFSRSDLVGLMFVGAACLASAALARINGSLIAIFAACVVYTIVIALWGIWELRRAQLRRSALSASGQNVIPGVGAEAG